MGNIFLILGLVFCANYKQTGYKLFHLTEKHMKNQNIGTHESGIAFGSVNRCCTNSGESDVSFAVCERTRIAERLQNLKEIVWLSFCSIGVRLH